MQKLLAIADRDFYVSSLTLDIMSMMICLSLHELSIEEHLHFLYVGLHRSLGPSTIQDEAHVLSVVVVGVL